MAEKGMVITIEGGNGSGKETQTKLLAENLRAAGREVSVFHYPEYETPTGQLIRSYLQGEFGPKEDLMEFASLLYAADRVKHQVQYQKLLNRGGVVVNDRYQESNWAIQGALIDDETKRQEVVSWMQQLEQSMPPSDLVVYLRVPVDFSLQLMEERARKQELTLDTHELDQDFLRKTVAAYDALAADQDHWQVIECVRQGRLRAVEDIQREVWEKVEKRS